MTELQPTLLLTRPEPQSRAFLRECETRLGRRLPVVISPLMNIQPTDEVPELDRYATVIFTSSNGVRSVMAIANLTGRSVITVGEKTAELARQAGAEAEALGEDVESLLERASQIRGPALFCRGVHSRGDLAARLRECGVATDEAEVYDQVSQPLSAAARSLLDGSAPVVAPVFSPRSARLLSAQGVITAPLTVIAMSPAVASAWTGRGRIVTSDRPTSASMCAAVTGLF